MSISRHFPFNWSCEIACRIIVDHEPILKLNDRYTSASAGLRLSCMSISQFRALKIRSDLRVEKSY